MSKPNHSLDYAFNHVLRKHYTIADGLAGMRVEDILQDRHGFLWVATSDGGLSRFDGTHFDNFDTGDGLPYPSVMCLAESRLGELWVGTLGGGIAIYDGERFRTVTVSDKLPSDMVINIKPGDDGTMYVFTYTGLVRCAEDGTVVSSGLAGFDSTGGMRDMATDGAGRTWFANFWSKESVTSDDKRQMELIHPTTGETIRSTWRLARDSQGNIWVSSLYIGSEIFVHRYDPRTEEVEIVQLESPAGTATVPNGIRHLRVDQRDRVWLTHRELVVHDGGRWLGLPPDHGEFQLHNPQISYEDREGNVWVGYWGNGLLCCDPFSTTRYTEADGLPDRQITALAEDRRGRVWVGTMAGLARMEAGDIAPLRPDPDRDHPIIMTLAVDDDDRVWVGADDGKAYRGQDDRFDILTIHPRGRQLKSFQVDGDNNVWTVLNAGGWGRITGDEFVEMPRQTVTDVSYQACMLDSRGTFWLGTISNSNSLLCCDGERLYPPPGLGTDRISYVQALCETPDGTVWSGTGNGLYAFDLDRGEMRRYTVKDGLPGNSVLALAADGAGRLWIGTCGGAARYDGEVFHTIRLGYAPLDNVEAILPAGDGQVWLGTRAGLVAYHSGAQRPYVTVRQVMAGQIYDRPHRVSFSESVPEVRIAYQGISFRVGAQQMGYSYRLLGSADERWSPFSNATEAVYPGLAPGEYHFEVCAVNRDGLRSDPVRVALDVAPDIRQDRIQALEGALAKHYGLDQFIGQSPAIAKVFNQMDTVAETDITVLIFGETGTGKGVAARAIHEISRRRNGPFIQVNCGALPGGLVESELFGHEKGAFTGAMSRQLGRFELAQGGTLFLDEIGDLPLEAQTALLQVLQDHTVQRVGGSQTISIDVRIIAATNRDLPSAMREGAFREDLYYRLSAFSLQLPPLRQRRDDIHLLVRYFAERFALHLNRPVPHIAPQALEWLRQYSWPGNVRELEHLIQRAVLVCQNDCIELENLTLGHDSAESATTTANGDVIPLAEYEKQAADRERQYLQQVLEKTKWVIYGDRGAAKMLGIHPEKLRARLKRYGLRRTDP